MTAMMMMRRTKINRETLFVFLFFFALLYVINLYMSIFVALVPYVNMKHGNKAIHSSI